MQIEEQDDLIRTFGQYERLHLPLSLATVLSRWGKKEFLWQNFLQFSIWFVVKSFHLNIYIHVPEVYVRFFNLIWRISENETVNVSEEEIKLQKMVPDFVRATHFARSYSFISVYKTTPVLPRC